MGTDEAPDALEVARGDVRKLIETIEMIDKYYGEDSDIFVMARGTVSNARRNSESGE